MSMTDTVCVSVKLYGIKAFTEPVSFCKIYLHSLYIYLHRLHKFCTLYIIKSILLELSVKDPLPKNNDPLYWIIVPCQVVEVTGILISVLVLC